MLDSGKLCMARASAEPIQPMPLGNMRQLGVHSLAVSYDLCHHHSGAEGLGVVG